MVKSTAPERFATDALEMARSQLKDFDQIGVWRVPEANRPSGQNDKVVIGLLDKDHPDDPSSIVFLTGQNERGMAQINFDDPDGPNSFSSSVPYGGGHNPLEAWQEALDCIKKIDL